MKTLDLSKLAKLNKKELKSFINSNGFFVQSDIQAIEKNIPDQYKDKVPEGAIYFEAIASNGDLNRNGYIIRPNAWSESIPTYMSNPQLLLQHDMDKPVGKVLECSVNQDGLYIKAYAFDDYTEGRLGRGLLNAISTGHYTLDVEFQNTATGQVITRDEFDKYNWEEQMSGDWVLCVTKLEMLECSLVSIPSNRKSLITTKDIMKNYLESMKNEAEEVEEVTPKETEEVETPEPTEPEVVEEPADVEVAEKPEEKVEPETSETKEEDKVEDKPVDTTETGEPETVATNAVAENAPNLDVVQVEKSDVIKLNNMVADLISTNEALVNEVQILREALSKVPNRKGHLFSSTKNSLEDSAKKTSALGALLEANNIRINN